MIDIAVANRPYEQGDLVSGSDLGWIRMPDTEDTQDFLIKSETKNKTYAVGRGIKRGQVIEKVSLISKADPAFLKSALRRHHALLPLTNAGDVKDLHNGERLDIFLSLAGTAPRIIQIAASLRVLESAEGERHLEIPKSQLKLYLTAQGSGKLTFVQTDQLAASDQIDADQILKEILNKEPIKAPVISTPPRALRIHRGSKVTELPVRDTAGGGIIRRASVKGGTNAR
ncbi:MAG: hypothetical protein JJ879_00645 [Sneathiella sp.]|nr:hypothetical protein [Sneathiella sp.]